MEVQFNHLFTHFVFTTKGRMPYISEVHRERIEKYITGIVNKRKCKTYAIYANPEHIHLLVSRDPAMSEKELADIIAEASEKFINYNNLTNDKFLWQHSCSAFSISKKHVDSVCKYIYNQPEHHKTQTAEEEYNEFLNFYQEKIRE